MHIRSTPLDKLTVTVVVDNETDSLSSVDSGIPQIPEVVSLLGRIPPTRRHDGHDCILVFDQLCVACHGLSVLVSGEVDNERHAVLFDTGPYGDIWVDNAERLGIDISMIEAIAALGPSDRRDVRTNLRTGGPCADDRARMMCAHSSLSDWATLVMATCDPMRKPRAMATTSVRSVDDVIAARGRRASVATPIPWVVASQTTAPPNTPRVTPIAPATAVMKTLCQMTDPRVSRGVNPRLRNVANSRRRRCRVATSMLASAARASSAASTERARGNERSPARLVTSPGRLG